MEHIKLIRTFVARRQDSRLRGVARGSVLRTLTEDAFMANSPNPLHVIVTGEIEDDEFIPRGYVVLTDKDFQALLTEGVIYEVSASATLRLADANEKFRKQPES